MHTAAAGGEKRELCRVPVIEPKIIDLLILRLRSAADNV
jgi:hypothetical protein